MVVFYNVKLFYNVELFFYLQTTKFIKQTFFLLNKIMCVHGKEFYCNEWWNTYQTINWKMQEGNWIVT